MLCAVLIVLDSVLWEVTSWCVSVALNACPCLHKK